MPTVRVLEGVASDVKLMRPSSGLGSQTATFKLGNPPERLSISGYALIEGEYVVAAVTPSIFQRIFRLFSRKPWTSDSVVAYTTMNIRGEIRGVGADYIWTAALYLLCASGLAISFLVMRGLAPEYLVASGLPRSVWPLILQYPDLAAALIALISIVLGLTGVTTLSTTREAQTALSSNNTVREAQERRAV